MPAACRSCATPRTSTCCCWRTTTGTWSATCAAGLVGGLGVTPGANIGRDCAIFEAVHGSAPDIAGQNKANPLALVMSAVMMLNHIDQRPVADRIKQAYNDVLSSGETGVLTADIGGQGGTRQFADAICERL